MAEVSREAGASGQQAKLLRGNAGAVSDDVASLRTALVRTVRTATTDADRRMEARVAVDVACSISLDGGAASVPGQLSDISLHGATINVGEGVDAEAGRLGTLVLTRSGDAPAGFEIRSQGGGRLHVRFLEGKADPVFNAAVRRLMETGQPAVKDAA